MSEYTSLSSGIAERYATAIFTLSKEEKNLDKLEEDMECLSVLLKKSKDFCSLITSPVYRRDQQEQALSALASYLNVHQQTKNLLCLLARKGRLFILPVFLQEVRELLTLERDEMGVEVVCANIMTISQVAQLEKKISALLNKKAKIDVTTDKSLISGMIIKLGSKMIDTTTKSKLTKLQSKMKEVN